MCQTAPCKTVKIPKLIETRIAHSQQIDTRIYMEYPFYLDIWFRRKFKPWK